LLDNKTNFFIHNINFEVCTKIKMQIFSVLNIYIFDYDNITSIYKIKICNTYFLYFDQWIINSLGFWLRKQKKTTNIQIVNDLEWTLWKIYYYFIRPPIRVRLNEVQFNLDFMRIIWMVQNTNLKLNGNLFLG